MGRKRQRSDSSEDDKSDTEYRMELEGNEESDSEEQTSKSKRKKKKVCTMKKKGLLEWTEKDEITLLEELSKFLEDNAYSYSPKAFYDFVKKRSNVNIELSMKELSDKIGELEKKYLENEYEKRKGDECSKLLEHGDKYDERLAFELSNRIWGRRKRNDNIRGEMKRAEMFMEFMEENEIHISCLKASWLEYLKKEWQLHLLMRIHLLSAKAKFDAKLARLTFYSNSLNTSTTQPSTLS